MRALPLRSDWHGICQVGADYFYKAWLSFACSVKCSVVLGDPGGVLRSLVGHVVHAMV